MEIFKQFTFDAAHHLPHVPEGHPCGRLHGHTYRVTVHVLGDVHDDFGWVMDFGDITAAMKRLLEQLDHRNLNDLLDNPTSELLAQWIFEQLFKDVPGLHKVIVSETPTSGAVYGGSQ